MCIYTFIWGLEGQVSQVVGASLTNFKLVKNSSRILHGFLCRDFTDSAFHRHCFEASQPAGAWDVAWIMDSFLNSFTLKSLEINFRWYWNLKLRYMSDQISQQFFQALQPGQWPGFGRGTLASSKPMCSEIHPTGHIPLALPVVFFLCKICRNVHTSPTCLLSLWNVEAQMNSNWGRFPSCR